MHMIIRKIALAVASAMVLSLATEVIKMLEKKLGNQEGGHGEGPKAKAA